MHCFNHNQQPTPPSPRPRPRHSWERVQHHTQEADLPSEQGRGLSGSGGAAGADRMLFPISLAARAAEDARSLRHRGDTRSVSHAPSPPGGE